MAKQNQDVYKGSEMKKYVVILPRTDIGVKAYGEVPKIGETSAVSPTKAVSNVLFRSNPRQARLMLHQLRETIGSRRGIENFAYEIPEIFSETPGEPVTDKDRAYFEPYLLASEMAERKGGDYRDHMPEADRVLRIVESDRRRRR